MAWAVTGMVALPDTEPRKQCTVAGCGRLALFLVTARQGDRTRELLRCVSHAAQAASLAGFVFPPVKTSEK